MKQRRTMKQIIYGNIRVQLYGAKLLRLEYGEHGIFCDESTFFIPNRDSLLYMQEESVEWEMLKEGVFSIAEYVLYLPCNASSLSGIRLEKNGKTVYSCKALANSGELPPLDRTPEIFALADNPRILIPKGGYSSERKGEYQVEENVQDIYLLLCRRDAKCLRRLYVELTGRSELVRLSVLGGWNSKYYAYNEETAKQLILDYEKNNVPLDVMVIDTDWRSCENGWGYDINTELFPDMARFLRFAHAHGVEVCFNDHPEPVDGAQVFAPEEIAYREKNLQALMEKGLDIWWYDRNWGTHLISPTKKIYWETLGMYLFEDISRHYWQKAAGDALKYRRPVIMGNVVNIANGVYSSITDSASHRYSVQWTGDIDSHADALAQEVDNLLRCTNNGIPYVNSDCGGHVGNPDKEQFIRWMQFGTLSPVFRPHCTKSVERTREPWAYDAETLEIVREYNHLRYRLLPVIYKNAYNAYETGEPVFKSPGFEYPEDKRAINRYDEYMLGNNILISPVAGYHPRPIAESSYITPVEAVFYNGTELSGEPIAKAEWKDLYMDLHHASPLEGVPAYYFSARFKTTVKFNKPYRLFLRNDDGATVYVDGRKVLEDKTLHSAMLFRLCDLTPKEEHKVEIEYFQAGGEAFCGLYAGEIVPEGKKQVYLPEGKWMDVFDGRIYCGKRSIRKEYGLRKMPLFVRLGALLPLACEAKNTKEQKWDRLIYDFYPCREASDSGYLYEDDGETTGYKLGEYRKSAYEAEYCKERSAFVIRLHAAEGSFSGERCFDRRRITLRYHLLKDADGVKRVTVNGEDIGFIRSAKDSLAFPLNAGAAVPDSGVIMVELEADVTREYEIAFCL